LLLPLGSALYADVTVQVETDGRTVIEGTTNVPGLIGESSVYTEKHGERWLLNISTPVLDTFVYRVTLPEGAQVNYVAGKNARITTSGDQVEIRGSGEDNPLALTVQYTLSAPQRSFSWLPLAGVAALLILLWALARVRRAPVKKTSSVQPSAPVHKTPAYLEGIPQRQQAIVTLLQRAGGTLTQRQIELTMKLPKSSVSRNVEALRRRGIIEKAQLGMTNTLVLAEKYR
jgi:uncharacterized membrane protein